jgi:hypothetical protein
MNAKELRHGGVMFLVSLVARRSRTAVATRLAKRGRCGSIQNANGVMHDVSTV